MSAFLFVGALIALAPPRGEVPMSLPPFALVDPASWQVFLSADDLVRYDWGRHQMVLRPGVKERLVRQLLGDLVRGRPFVLMADGQRCYEGVFTTSLSSNRSWPKSSTWTSSTWFTRNP